MLLMIEQPQVRFTASHRTPQTLANAGDWALDVALNPAPARQKAGIKAGLEMGLRAAGPARGRSTRVLAVDATAKMRARRCSIAQ